jgi:K+-sensing histidine kinase KdpD
MNIQKKRRIVVVEDNELIIFTLTNILTNNNYIHYVAQNGKSAIELILKELPDIILLDIVLPEFNGFQICQIIKTNPLTKDIPIIFLTSMNDTESIKKAFEVGAEDYVVKPFNFVELLSRINTHIELKENREKLKRINKNLEEIVEERTHELLLANKELIEANQKLSKLDKAKNNFINLISHELRTPLSGIIGFAGLLEKDLSDGRHKNFVHQIQSSATKLQKLSDESLLITTLIAGNYQVYLQKITLKYVMNDLILANSEKIKAKKIQINIDIIENLNVTSDSKLIYHCFSIIMDNAIKFCANEKSIFINGYHEKDNICIEFMDEGAGFSENSLSQIFNFFTIENIQHHTEGLGLGLATAKLIMENLSGKIEAFNQTGKGAIIKLTFK